MGSQSKIRSGCSCLDWRFLAYACRCQKVSFAAHNGCAQICYFGDPVSYLHQAWHPTTFKGTAFKVIVPRPLLLEVIHPASPRLELHHLQRYSTEGDCYPPSAVSSHPSCISKAWNPTTCKGTASKVTVTRHLLPVVIHPACARQGTLPSSKVQHNSDEPAHNLLHSIVCRSRDEKCWQEARHFL